jgi:hypothetical protein
MAKKRKRKQTVADKINRGRRATERVFANFTNVMLKAARKGAK